MRTTIVVLAAMVLAVAGCGGSPEPQRTPVPSRGGATVGAPTVLVSHLNTPWGVAFLPGGDALVAERNSGRILRVTPDASTSIVTTIEVTAGGESGLLGLAVSPTYPSDHLVYAYYTGAQDNRVVRFTLDAGRVGALQPVLTGIPSAAIHDGGRIAFGPDGMLYVGTGDAGDGDRAQDLHSLGGKILRIRGDGSIPAGNPFPASPVWTLGHRNVQGLAWDGQGRMFATEFGPDRADEINRIEPGRNYGWPTVVGRDPKGHDPRFTDPLVTFPTGTNSASGLAITDGALWTAALRGTRLWRIPEHADGSLGEPQALFVGRYGRLRTVVVAPGGGLWVTTSNRDGRGDPVDADDRILQIPLD